MLFWRVKSNWKNTRLLEKDLELGWKVWELEVGRWRNCQDTAWRQRYWLCDILGLGVWRDCYVDRLNISKKRMCVFFNPSLCSDWFNFFCLGFLSGILSLAPATITSDDSFASFYLIELPTTRMRRNLWWRCWGVAEMSKVVLLLIPTLHWSHRITCLLLYLCNQPSYILAPQSLSLTHVIRRISVTEK